ncbi:UDP-N-acetylmuramoyl-L-alanyl-D-glutamate--2,6-diaminopimelate ligase [Massilia sp. W12]|uniref:UDP-N-acetylmuramoyl-L-alanyl-D-glutamate--2, 6-diaminopimelate ligase n=1 Tax=Massilia sp. W12 TaxID=3126507 RepID=UPI0030CAFB07
MGAHPHHHGNLHIAEGCVRLCADSRQIQAGDVFFAYPGDVGDGRKYIGAALAAGAQAVLFDDTGFVWDDSWQAPHFGVTGLKTLAGYIASEYYGHPDADIFTVAITGTNGKTSCALWSGRALARPNAPSAVMGTLGVGLLHASRAKVEVAFDATGFTTPDAVLLQTRLVQMRAAGAQALALEASSIGLAQGRMNGLHVDAAVFTNLTRDHLDFHGDMQAYEEAKSLLFEWPGLKIAVVNLDDPMGPRLVARMQQRAAASGQHLPQIIGYSVQGASLPGIAVLQASEIRSRHGGAEFHLDSPWGSVQCKTHLVGLFNVSNVLAVAGVLLGRGVNLRVAQEAIEALHPAPGRMQQLGGHDAPLIVIDYAHTPDALAKTLAALRPVAQERGGELWCVFGCGGERDPGKRPQMGQIAEAAEHVLVTSDNPRGEDPHQIIQQILAGASRPLQAIEDRAAAILSAVKHAARQDVVLIAGKGHEDYQEIRGKKLPFSDADHAQLALATRVSMKRSA